MVNMYNRIFDQAEKSVEDDSYFLKRREIGQLPKIFADLEFSKRKAKGEFFNSGLTRQY